MQLHTKAIAAPMLWAPVMASILRDHVHNMPEACCPDLLQAMHRQSFTDMSAQGEVLWTLRYFHALAAAWPAVSVPGIKTVQKTDTPVSSTDTQWKVCLFATYTAYVIPSDMAQELTCGKGQFECMAGCIRIQTLHMTLGIHKCLRVPAHQTVSNIWPTKCCQIGFTLDPSVGCPQC